MYDLLSDPLTLYVFASGANLVNADTGLKECK